MPKERRCEWANDVLTDPRLEDAVNQGEQGAQGLGERAPVCKSRELDAKTELSTLCFQVNMTGMEL